METHDKSDRWFKYFLVASSLYFFLHLIHAIAKGAIL